MLVAIATFWFPLARFSHTIFATPRGFAKPLVEVLRTRQGGAGDAGCWNHHRCCRCSDEGNSRGPSDDTVWILRCPMPGTEGGERTAAGARRATAGRFCSPATARPREAPQARCLRAGRPRGRRGAGRSSASQRSGGTQAIPLGSSRRRSSPESMGHRQLDQAEPVADRGTALCLRNSRIPAFARLTVRTRRKLRATPQTAGHRECCTSSPEGSPACPLVWSTAERGQPHRRTRRHAIQCSRHCIGG